MSLTTLLAFLKCAPETINWTTKKNETPLQIAENAKIHILGTPTWHIHPGDYQRVIQALKNPRVLDALHQAQQATSTAPHNLDKAVAANQRKEVYVGIPVDPEVRALVAASGWD